MNLSSSSPQFEPSRLALLQQKLESEAEIRRQRKIQSQPGGLIEFVRYFWRVLEPQIPLVEGWALTAICEHLEAVTTGKITRLLINVPPGFMKSMLTDVFWPAWEWACMDRAHYRYVTFSYSATLTERDNGRFRDLLCSPEFQRLWGHKFEVTTIGVTRVANNKTGWKLASSVGGVGTGERGDRVIADDLHNVKEAESEVVRTETVRWFQEGAENRLNDLRTGAIVVIMQRVHEMDVSGAILKDGTYVHLLIPMEFEPARAKPTSIGWRDPRKEDGELAWPERFDAKVLEPFRRRAYMWAGQYQQRPEPRGGAIFKRDWWQNWNDETAKQFGVKPGFLPSFSYVLGILDTAYTTKEDRDPSAMTVLGLFHDAQGNPNVLLVNAFEEWLEFPDLVNRVIKLAQATRIDRLLIEAKSAGLSVAQEMQRRSGHLGFAVETVDPGKSDKLARAHAQTYAFEESMVWAPGYEDGTFRKFSTKVIDQMAMFPRAEHDDLCFVAGTMIATRRGPIPIERVKVGDEVVTPIGWRRVSASSCTGVRHVVQRGPLIGTASHPVFSLGRGYIRLQDVHSDTRFARASLCGLIQTIHPRQLNLMGLYSGSWVADANTTSASQPPMLGDAMRRDCMSQSGNRVTAQFLRGMKYITGIAIRSIAALIIWSAYRKACIAAYARSILTEPLSACNWRKSAPSRWSGTSLMKGARGIWSMPRLAWRKLETRLSAILDTKLCLVLANAHGAGQSLNFATERTSFAPQSAPISVAGTSAEGTSSSTRMQPVFNLTVEGAHCYYANGVLVHNCDTVVMGLRYLRDYGLLVRREEHSRSITERMQFRGRQKKLYDV